jgi:hypothetical protein
MKITERSKKVERVHSTHEELRQAGFMHFIGTPLHARNATVPHRDPWAAVVAVAAVTTSSGR